MADVVSILSRRPVSKVARVLSKASSRFIRTAKLEPLLKGRLGPHGYIPSKIHLRLTPSTPGNRINGLGETQERRPTPIYWHDPSITKHGRLQLWQYLRTLLLQPTLMDVASTNQRLQQATASEQPPSAHREERSPETWTSKLRQTALGNGAADCGVARVRPEWIYTGYQVDLPWAVTLAFPMDAATVASSPLNSALEVMEKYNDGLETARRVADWVRAAGYRAQAHSGPEAGPINLIPAAIAGGLGELGKHGSIIHREFGSSFRLAVVLTNMPLTESRPDSFGVDDFCSRCKVCSKACPADAIAPEKQTVRGAVKWYVDFDKCLPVFIDDEGCALCIAVCPWSRPGMAARFAEKQSKRLAR